MEKFFSFLLKILKKIQRYKENLFYKGEMSSLLHFKIETKIIQNKNKKADQKKF